MARYAGHGQGDRSQRLQRWDQPLVDWFPQRYHRARLTSTPCWAAVNSGPGPLAKLRIRRGAREDGLAHLPCGVVQRAPRAGAQIRFGFWG